MKPKVSLALSVTLFLWISNRRSDADGDTKHARIQEFSSEGVQISENFDKQKKKRGGGEEKVPGKKNGGLWSFFRFCRSLV